MNYALAKLKTENKHIVFHGSQGNLKQDDIVYCPVSRDFELVEGFVTTQGVFTRCSHCYEELD